MSTSTSNAAAASIHVEMHARGVNCDADVQTASYAVAEWLNTQNTRTLATDYTEYLAAEINGEAGRTDGSRRFVDLIDEAYAIAESAATHGWADPSGADITVTITPRT